ncbi:MAG TPA: TIGR03435 family protein [Bryobacteraceae bacterium]|nr:TIGR03435 family protein [Bryobacteraceae bacterium]
MRLAIAIGVAALPLMGQPRFEVVSVKPAPQEPAGPTRGRGGPGTSDPGRITEPYTSLLRLIHGAYSPGGAGDPLHSLDWDQISGPAWLSTEHYAIDAKLPPETTREDLRLMWQALLAERFHLQVHFTTRDFTVYELVVAKYGPKLRKTGEVPDKPPPGFPVVPPGAHRAMGQAPPRTIRYSFRDYPISDFVQLLAWPLTEEGAQMYAGAFTVAKVLDKTGLDGRYDFTFEFAGYMYAGGAYPRPLPDGRADTAPALFEALQQQLGLRLERTRAKLNVLVVDHVDKVPTPN